MALVSTPLLTMPGSSSMNFTENQHGPLLLYHLQQQRGAGAFCDVRLTVDGRNYGAHRCVLAAASEFFAQLFAAPARRAHEQVTIRCGDDGEASSGADVFGRVLDYIYSGSVVVDRYSVSELVRLANHLAVPKLKAHCAEYLTRYLHVDNCLTVLDTAAKYRLPELERAALVFIRQNADAVLNSRYALQLPSANVEQIVRDQRIQLPPERQLVFVLDWVWSGLSAREHEMRQLLLSVPLELIDADISHQLLHSHQLLIESERCLLMLLQSLSDAGVRLCEADQETLRQLEVKFDQVNDLVDNDAFLSMAITTAIEELESTESAIFDGLHRLQQQTDPSQIQTISAEDLSLTVDSARDLRCHMSSSAMPASDPSCDPGPGSAGLGPIPLVARAEHMVPDRGAMEFDSSTAGIYSFVEPSGSETAFYDSSLLAPPSITDQRHGYDSSALDYGMNPALEDSLAQTIATTVPVDALPVNLLAAAVAASDSGAAATVSSSDEPSLGGVNFSCRYSGEDRLVGMNASGGSDTLLIDRETKTAFSTSTSFTPHDQSAFIQSHSQPQCMVEQTDEDIGGGGGRLQMLPTNLHYRGEPPTQSSTERLHTDIEQNQWPYIVTSHQHPLPYQTGYEQGEGQFVSSQEHCDNEQFNTEPAPLLEQETQFDGGLQARNAPSTKTFAPEQISYQAGNRPNEVEQYNRERYCGEVRQIGFESGDNCVIARASNGDSGVLVEQHETAVSSEQLPASLRPEQLPEEAVGDDLISEKEQLIVSDTEAKANLPISDQNTEKHGVREGGQRCQQSELAGEQRESSQAEPRTETLPATMPAKKRKLVPVLAQILADSAESETAQTTSYKFKKYLSHMSLHSEQDRTIATDKLDTVNAEATAEGPVEWPPAVPNPRPVRSRARQLYRCDICATTVNTHRQYLTHMQSHFDGPPFVCTTCGRESRALAEFLRHRRTHVQNRPHRCSECGCSFWKRYDLLSHMRVHSGERPYSCDQCGARFALLSTLRQHSLRHQSERQLSCDQCDFTTKYISHMSLHKKLHTGDLHRCSHAHCNYTTPKRSHLREHLQSHAARRTYQCPECPLAYNVKTHLSRHMRVHKSTGILRCNQCEYTAHRTDQLKSHMKKHERQAASSAQQQKSWHGAELAPGSTGGQMQV